MRVQLIAVCLLAGLAAATSRGAEQENPFKNAKVGDWVAYTMTTKVMDKNIDGKVKMTVTGKEEREVRVATITTVNGMEFPNPESKIDLTKPYDPTQTDNLPKGSEAKVEKVGTGKETITVGDKKYDCTWIKMKVDAKVMGNDFSSEVKVWTSKSVPLSGMVKMEMKSKVADVVMTLEDSGSKK